MRIPIIAVLLVAATAEASRVHTPRPVLSAVEAGHATLTLVLTTASRDPREVVRAIDIPPGMVATGMTLSTENGDSLATADVRDSARRLYDRIVEQIKDPALLEWTSTHRARLRVYPVTRDAPATVTIELMTTLEAGDLVHLDPHTSLIASPWQQDDRKRDSYDDYWPTHTSD